MNKIYVVFFALALALYSSGILDNTEAIHDQTLSELVEMTEGDNTWLCSICQAENTYDDVYCTKCGQTRRCLECNSSIPMDNKYCTECGAEMMEEWNGQQIEGAQRPDDSLYYKSENNEDIALVSAKPYNFIEAVSDLYDDNTMILSALGDRLVLMIDYDQFQGDLENEFALLDEYEEELKQYHSIVVLIMKDNIVYLANELFLEDGKIKDIKGNILMSTHYLIDAANIVK